MTYFKNKYKMLKASDDEIREFFTSTIFEGIFSTEIKSNNHADYFKGHIHSIKINGEPTNLIGSYINVSKSANDIPEGECTFKCHVKDVVRTSPSQINFSLSPKTLRSKKAPKPLQQIESKEDDITNEDLFELWGVNDCEFIGFYHFDSKSGGYLIDDLRKTNFDRIPPYLINKRPISLWLKYPQKDIELDNYYRFKWKLSHKDPNNPYEIYLDNRYSPEVITPKWFIDKLFEDRHSDKSKNFGSAANFLDTLSKQLSARESTFVYELLQNAYDYPVEGKMVDVEFHITDNYLLFLHSGEKFNVRNISGICGINEKEKITNRKAIGYKGIGFKTVFLNNHYVYLRTGDYSFRFDQGETPEKKRGGKIKRQDAPFQILPIWTEHNEVAKEVNNIFDNSSDEFRVKIALRPDNKSLLHIGRNCYENLFREIFSDSNIILFIPNINSVRVFINGQEERACFRNNEEWVVGNYDESDISPNLQKRINKTIENGKSRIPEKYKNFDYTKVSFACKHKGAMIEPVNDTILYCYLPTSTSWGFPFLMNTDMIPKGDRDKIEKEVGLLELNEKEDGIEDNEEMNFNKELASIAGSKFFFWIRDLLTSRKYQLGSAFSLVPDFKKCKKEHEEYSEYIEKFEKSFKICLETETIVPVPQGIALVNKVILDTTGLSKSGIMTDDEFRKFTGMEDYYLPLPMLRKDKHFCSFLKRYAEDEQKFEFENLTDLISNESFQEWLKVQDNNDKFLNFLLEKGYLKVLMGEEIFLEADGDLYCASDLFYDIDEYLIDLQAFTNRIYYLSPKTREFFKNNEIWDNVIDGEFANFDCDSFIDETLLSTTNIAETKKALGNKDTSIHFYKFLSENVDFTDKYKSLPFFTDSDEVEDDFEDKFVFFQSDQGRKVFENEWLASIDIAFVSPNYTLETKRYFADNFGVRTFSDEIIVKEIILSEDYHDMVSENIDDDYSISKSFVDYCYAHKNLFDDKALSNYSLMAYDCNGDEQWYFADGDVFFPSSNFDYYSSKEWIEAEWMVAVECDYYKDGGIDLNRKEFLSKAFGVIELDDEILYTNIIKGNHLKDIIKSTQGNNDPDGTKNIDFVKYLDDNYNLIFERYKDGEDFSALTPVSDCNRDLDISDDVYLYDDELAAIMDNSWFPKDVVFLCNEEYGNSKALKAIGCNTYNFSSFYDSVIVEELEAINNNIKTKEDSIAFHNFIIANIEKLTTGQQAKMGGAKVFLYGNDEPAGCASGHKILSARAKELFDKGLVQFGDLDLIDPDYKTEQNTEYWENRLENTKFTITHFYIWLKENADTFKNTLQDINLNIEFWRWLKVNADDKQLDSIPVLPVLLKDGTIDNDSTAIYFSDEYMKGSGIEQSVLKFDEEALFISPDYIGEEENIEEWKSFWSKLGIKYEIVDILIKTIIPNLADIEDEGLPKLIADNRDALEKYYEEEGLISQLTHLHVKAHDGEFYDINDTIYVDCEKDEPFPYVELPNQITFKTREERELIKDIIVEVESDFVETLSEWQQRKLNRYLQMQDEDSESIREFHFQFINDLSIIRNTSQDSLKKIEGVEKIYLLNNDDDFCEPSTLTMGSVYKPFFDFEACSIDTLEYVNDSYIERCTDYPGRLFRALKVHCDIQKEDLDYLEDRECAIYFWSRYLIKKEANISKIKDFLEDKLFDNIACIPNKDCMKSPADLYYGGEIPRYIKAIEDWENKTPLKDIPEIKFSDGSTIFEKLPFKNSLNFLDALYALVNISGQERRTQLLQWMIDDYDESYDVKVNEYREDENALWNNNNNKHVQIKQLYALDYWENTLDQYFGANPRIVNKAYFPSGNAFKEACNILQIQTITLDDLDMQPVDKKVYAARDINHRLYALAFAALIEPDNWQELYNSYIEKLTEVVFYKCKSILILYKQDETISQSLKKFYHKPGTSDFYFVKDLDDKLVYESYVKEFTSYLGIDEDDIPFDLTKIIMDSRESALEKIKEQNSLMLDEAFKDAMDALIPGIKHKLSGNEAESDDEDVIGDNRPSFTTQDNNYDEKNDDDVISQNQEESNEPTVSDSYDVINDSNKDYELLSEDEYVFDGEELEALQNENAPEEDDFINATIERIIIDGVEDEVVCEHYRSGTWVRGHMRNGYWVNGYWRNDYSVSAHTRTSGSHVGNASHNGFSRSSIAKINTENTPSKSSHDKKSPVGNFIKPHTDNGDVNDSPSTREPHEKQPRATTTRPTTATERKRPYSDMGGWEGTSGSNRLSAPKPFSPEDVRNFGSHGITRTLEVLEPTTSEIDEINIILGEDLSSEQVADQNYLAQLRLYNNLIKKGMTPDESKSDFVRNAHMKNEHTIGGGKYIHKCSAVGGIMYLSPAIWNKIADDRCVVCVYLGAKANEFMYFNSIDDILEWIGEDDIIIKLTGEEKADVVKELYSGVLNGVKGTAYTLIRINSNEKYNSLFAQLPTNNNINETEENEDEY